MGFFIDGSGAGHLATLNFMCLRQFFQSLRPCVTEIPCSFFFPNTRVSRYYSFFFTSRTCHLIATIVILTLDLQSLSYCCVLLLFSWRTHLSDLSVLCSLQLICHRTFFVYCVLFSKQYIWRFFLSFCAAWMRSTHVILVRFI